MKRNACKQCVFAVYDNKPHCGLRGFTNDFNVEYCSAEDDVIPNGYELQEDGYFSWVEKKKEYPKTFRECQECLGEDVPPMEEPDSKTHRRRQVHLLEVLLICRDAYWKLYGEEKGLGKPWEPDWDGGSLYLFYYNPQRDEFVKIKYSQGSSANSAFVFPTAEMRDAFKENFDPDIDTCKESSLRFDMAVMDIRQSNLAEMTRDALMRMQFKIAELEEEIKKLKEK